MTIGETLLNLTAEYHQSVVNRSPEYAYLPGNPAGREAAEIAAEYETVLRGLLVGSAGA
jgi:hypothetical protein